MTRPCVRSSVCEHGAGFLGQLNGIFAFALWDAGRKRVLVARDALGVCPLYWGHDRAGRLCVASEMKSLVGVCADVAPFPPGHVYDSETGEAVRYWTTGARRGGRACIRSPSAWKARPT